MAMGMEEENQGVDPLARIRGLLEFLAIDVPELLGLEEEDEFSLMEGGCLHDAAMAAKEAEEILKLPDLGIRS